MAAVFLMLSSSIVLFAPGLGAVHLSSPPAPLAGTAGPLADVPSGAALQRAPSVANPGSAYSPVAGDTIQGTVNPASPTMFTVGFPMRNSQALASLINAQSVPGSPQFHQWLTLDQETQMFGADPAEVQATVNYFTSLGFTVQTRGLLSVSFSGPAALTSAAFHTRLANVVTANGTSLVENLDPLTLPAPIAPGIASVNGFTSPNTIQPTHSVAPQAATDLIGQPSVSYSASPPAMAPGYTPITNWTNISTLYNYSNQAFGWFRYFSHHYQAWETFQLITPASLNFMYDANPILAQGYNGDSTGTPINIAIVMAGGINPDDLQGYSQLVWNNPNQILSRLSPIPVDGAFTANGTVAWTDGASGEMALDIEYSGTMAPKAHITAVYGPCLCTNVLDDDYATILNMNPIPSIVSNSWGGDEDRWPNAYGPNWNNQITMHNYFMLMSARGSSVLASSGDGGGFDTATGMLAGSNPATDPYVLAINGVRTSAADSQGQVFPKNPAFGWANTTIYSLLNWPIAVSPTASVSSESYWYEPITNKTLYSAPPSGSGGFGTSYWYNQSWWQHAPGLPDLGRSFGSGVSAEADFNQSIFFLGAWEFLYGGTSFACPTTAGMFGDILDYLAAHGHGRYLGDANTAVWLVANAWQNGNLTLDPFADVVNGSSYWGNKGVENGWQWPPGQMFPHDSMGAVTYGLSMRGYDFPTGWGVIDVTNFAKDLNFLYGLPGTFMTTDSTGTAWNVGGWTNLALNHTYHLHVNASAALALSNPQVTLKFDPQVGSTFSLVPTLTQTIVPSSGYSFTIDTSQSPFISPGLLIFQFGNATDPTLGFAYTWVAQDIPPGTINVTVIAPQSSSILGGYPQFNPTFGMFSTFNRIVAVDPNCCVLYPNSFEVQVTFNGKPVYNAQVLASVPSPYLLAWQGSIAQNSTQSLGNAHEITTSIVSSTFTNASGIAFVYTWNAISPTTYFVNATYGSSTGGTTYQVVPGPNIKAVDARQGAYSSFDWVSYFLNQSRQTVNNQTLNNWVRNEVNQSAYYSMGFAWQGQEFPVSVNNWQGTNLPGIKLWVGTWDFGSEYPKADQAYKATYGAFGITNWTNTSAVTDGQGRATLQIPDNFSLANGFINPNGSPYAGIGFIAADAPGQFNRTFQYSEPCAPTLPNTASTITCTFNDTYQRNYTTLPIMVLPDPVDAWTQSTALVHQDFFGVGANISVGLSVHLPQNNPFLIGIGTNWLAGPEHVTSVKAYIDGQFAGDLTPSVPPYVQSFATNGNLTGTYGPGIHILKVVVTDSTGHTFTRSHRFIVGSVAITNLNIQNTYLPIPYLLNWTLNLPVAQINNLTFNQTLQISYVTGGCGGIVACPLVVNYSERIHNGVPYYNQSINSTLLNLDHFYSGASQFPPGQYQITVWLIANGSGSISTSVPTYFIFNPLHGTINGPGPNSTVPLGNLTISYSYTGDYVSNASVYVFPSGGTNPVFRAGAFVPGYGDRGNSTTWQAANTGAYEIVLALGSPYGSYNATEWINVSNLSPFTYVNQTSRGPLAGMNPAVSAAVLAVVGTILGLLAGLFVAPGLKASRTAAAGGAKAPAKAWEEGPSSVAGAHPAEARCSVCRETFETDFALHQHQKIVHGLEE